MIVINLMSLLTILIMVLTIRHMRRTFNIKSKDTVRKDESN